MVAFAVIWHESVRSGSMGLAVKRSGKKAPTFMVDVKSLFNENVHKLLVTPPFMMIAIFTMIPLVDMMLMAFTNYSAVGDHLILFDWVGLQNFKSLFDSGSAEIKKESVGVIDKIGDILKTYDKHLIKIEGHTDTVPMKNGKYESNMWLSTARATKVFEYLVNKKGLSPKTLEASGRGEYEPLASNDTREGRAKNRRVEIKIYTETN